MLKTFHASQLVSVRTDGDELDGVVVHTTGLVKVEVAVAAERGPTFVNVHPKALTPREQPGESDDALRRLIRRGAAAARADGGSGHGRRGHGRAAGHRTTGK